MCNHIKKIIKISINTNTHMFPKQSFKSQKKFELVLPILFPNVEYYFTSHIRSIIAPSP